jgi:hypothetical protein
MNFEAMVAEVVRITKRPAKIVDIRREVNAAINFCCVEGNFARDRMEDLIPISPTDYAQAVDLSDFTRWRKFDYLRVDNRNCFLNRIEPIDAFRGGEQVDVYYVVGEEVKIKIKTLAPNLIAAWYTYPPILSGTDTFWLTEVSPFMIINMASANIFSEVGNTTESNRLQALANIAFVSAQRDYKYGANYG